MTDTIKKLQEVREALVSAIAIMPDDICKREGFFTRYLECKEKTQAKSALATLDAVIAGLSAQVMGEPLPMRGEATGAEGALTPSPATNSAKPLHRITQTGCSICGTDAANCSVMKSLGTKEKPALTPEQRDELLAVLKPFSQLAREAREFRHSHDSTCLWRIKASDLFAAEEAEKRLLGKE